MLAHCHCNTTRGLVGRWHSEGPVRSNALQCTNFPTTVEAQQSMDIFELSPCALSASGRHQQVASLLVQSRVQTLGFGSQLYESNSFPLSGIITGADQGRFHAADQTRTREQRLEQIPTPEPPSEPSIHPQNYLGTKRSAQQLRTYCTK